MKRVALISSGVAVFLAALWGGAYLSHLFPYGHWAGVAAATTSFMVAVGGFALITAGIEAKK
jgi:hypothetical protein